MDQEPSLHLLGSGAAVEDCSIWPLSVGGNQEQSSQVKGTYFIPTGQRGCTSQQDAHLNPETQITRHLFLKIFFVTKLNFMLIPHCWRNFISVCLKPCIPTFLQAVQKSWRGWGWRDLSLDHLSMLASVEMSSSPSGLWSQVQVALYNVFLVSTRRPYCLPWFPVPYSCLSGLETALWAEKLCEVICLHPSPSRFPLHHGSWQNLEDLAWPLGSIRVME